MTEAEVFRIRRRTTDVRREKTLKLSDVKEKKGTNTQSIHADPRTTHQVPRIVVIKSEKKDKPNSAAVLSGRRVSVRSFPRKPYIHSMEVGRLATLLSALPAELPGFRPL